MKKTLSATLAFLTAVSTIISTVLSVLVTASAAPSGALFSDVADGRWSAASVGYAVDEGYMIGVGDGKFDPEGAMTRAAAVTVLWRREGEPEPTESSGFFDVPTDEWYARAVAWAGETGIVMGVTDKEFDPEKPITREQLAAMLYRYAEHAPVSVPERADLDTFSDGDRISDWAKEPLAWAVEAGLVKGIEDGRLAPDSLASREQFAAIIERYDGAFKLKYNDPVVRSTYTEKEYPLVTDADFYVSPTGSDENDGTFDHPFATFGKAIGAVRELKERKAGDITVAFMAGEYGPLSLELTADDSGSPEQKITYCAYGDGDVFFSDGFGVAEEEFVPVGEEERRMFPAAAANAIKKADVSDRLGQYDPVKSLVISEAGVLTLARFPNVLEDGTDDLLSEGGYNFDDNHVAITHPLLLKRIAKYRAGERIYLYGFLTTGWSKDYLETDGFDDETDMFFIPHPETTTAGYLRRLPEFDSAEWNRIALVNVSEELDCSGEYWIDPETKTFYVYDPSGDYEFAGDRGVMITAYRADNVTLRGLTFKNSVSAFMEAEHSHGITLDRCSFSGCAAKNALSVKECDVGRDFDITVSGCDFRLMAGTALMVEGDGDLEVLYFNSGGVLIDNNSFELISLVYGTKGAINISTNGAVISHNDFKRISWEAIFYHNAINMTVEYNVFDEVCCNGDDTGVLENYSELERCGNVIRYNLFLNINGGTNGRYGVYLDGSSGTEIYSNLFWGCDRIVMHNTLNKLASTHDNVIVNPDLTDSAAAQIHPASAYFNETAESDDEVIADETYQRFVGLFRYFAYRPALKALVAEDWPELFEITTDISRRGDPEFCLNTSVVITGNYEINRSGKVLDDYPDYVRRYCVIENNPGFTTDENPLFVNPTLGDYRIRDGVDFPDIHFENIGRY